MNCGLTAEQVSAWEDLSPGNAVVPDLRPRVDFDTVGFDLTSGLAGFLHNAEPQVRVVSKLQMGIVHGHDHTKGGTQL